MNHFYKVLGVSSTATGKELKKAYRQKAMQWHPDRNPHPDAQRKFIELDQAYNYLLDLKAGKISRQRNVVNQPTTQRTSTYKLTAEMDADEMKRAFQKAQITQDYVERKNKMDRKATPSYILVSFLSIIFGPILAIILGSLTDPAIGIIMFFVFPGLGLYYFNYWIYQGVERRRKVLYKEYRERLKKI